MPSQELPSADVILANSRADVVRSPYRSPGERWYLFAVEEPVQFAIMIVAILAALWLVLYPLGWLTWGAFHLGAPGAIGGWTFANFTDVFLDPTYWTLVGRSLLVGIGITLFATVIGVPLAWVTVKTDMPGRRLVEMAAILPFFTSTFIGALAWIFIGNPTNGLLKLWFGLPGQYLFAVGHHLGDRSLYGSLHLPLHFLRTAQYGYQLRGSVVHGGRQPVSNIDEGNTTADFSGVGVGHEPRARDLSRYIRRRRNSRLSQRAFRS